MSAMILRGDEAMFAHDMTSAAAVARDAIGHAPHGRRREFIGMPGQLAARP